MKHKDEHTAGLDPRALRWTSPLSRPRVEPTQAGPGDPEAGSGR